MTLDIFGPVSVEPIDTISGVGHKTQVERLEFLLWGEGGLELNR